MNTTVCVYVIKHVKHIIYDWASVHTMQKSIFRVYSAHTCASLLLYQSLFLYHCWVK